MKDVPVLGILLVLLAIIGVPYLIGKIRDKNSSGYSSKNHHQSYSNNYNTSYPYEQKPLYVPAKEPEPPKQKPKQSAQPSHHSSNQPEEKKTRQRKCSSCGAPIPVGTGKLPEIHCRYCGAPIQDADTIILETIKEQNRQKELELAITREKETTKRREMETQLAIERERGNQIRLSNATKQQTNKKKSKSGCLETGCVMFFIYAGVILAIFWVLARVFRL